MKIYFAGSVRGGREDAALYAQIVAELQQYGEVLTEHIGSSAITNKGEDLPLEVIYDRDVQWLDSADVLVAEVTTPSIGVGYEIGRAEAQGKRVLCLFRPNAGRLISAMIGGNKKMVTKEYAEIDDVRGILKNFFSQQ